MFAHFTVLPNLGLLIYLRFLQAFTESKVVHRFCIIIYCNRSFWFGLFFGSSFFNFSLELYNISLNKRHNMPNLTLFMFNKGFTCSTK